MPLKQRAKAIDAFQNDPPTTVRLSRVMLACWRSDAFVCGTLGVPAVECAAALRAALRAFALSDSPACHSALGRGRHHSDLRIARLPHGAQFALLRTRALADTHTQEPVMNPALEAQAIGRSWRMGQTRAVTVHKLFIKDSVEQRIVELVAQRVAPGGKAAEGTSAMDALRASKGKAKILVSEVRAAPRSYALQHAADGLRHAQIAGAIRDDKQALRLTELELLFSVRPAPAPRVRALCADASALQ
jgi:hypothetical protein